MPLTEPQQRILARKLALHRAVIGPVTDGRRLVDEAWGEAQTPDELRQITALMHYACEYGVEPDYMELGRILAGQIVRHGLAGVTDSELADEANDIAEMKRETA